MEAKKSLLVVLSLIFICVSFTDKANAASVTDTSISGELAGMNTSKLIIVPAPNGGAAKEYDSNAVGLKAALYDLYQFGNNQDFAMYVGTNITTMNGADAKNLSGTPSAANMTFSTLEGKVKTLVITSTTADTINNNTSLPTGTKYLTFASNAYMGSNVIFRNVDYRGTNLYMNGHDLNLNGGSYGNGLSIYGGSDTSDISGSPTITVNSTGSGVWNFYGGNSTGGTLTGNPSLVFNNSSAAVNTISGGAKVGTVAGNVNVRINDLGGRLTSYFGGGEGTAVNKANVKGNVTNEINVTNSATKMVLSPMIYGGVSFGDISGTITNTLTGYGSFYGSATPGGTTTPGYIGGSREGNIGTDRAKNAITTNFDSSKYSSGRLPFAGGNAVSGIIQGNIVNNVRAGSNREGGAISGAYGGGSRAVAELSATLLGTSALKVNAANEAFDALGKDARRELAKSKARFQVYGNIDLNLLGGNVSIDSDDTYTRAAGYGGYIEGDTTVVVGTLNADGSVGGDGMVYSNYTETYNKNNTAYDKTKNTRSFNSGYDIVGGGGSPSHEWSIYIYGRTKTVMNNSIARWTYGGNFSGTVEHPDGYDADTYASEYVMNGGIADTTEGTGYIGQRTYGPSHTQINYGQVDWFTSGAGWGDWKQFGDASVEFVKGIHNGTVGGTYGYDIVNGTHVINGDVSVTILGGDFSGTPSHTGNKNFSAGPSEYGTINGNATLTLDLTTENGKTFVPPPTVKIAAGRHDGSGSNVELGTGNSIVTLNIFTNEESGDVLKGATIYGDGGTASAPSKVGHIKMNIDAPGSTIGTLYATQYSNIASNELLRNVDVNIQRVKSIGGISGGNAGDNINNNVAKNSLTNNKGSNFQIGVPVEGAPSIEFQKEPILVSGIGIINFTSLLVDNGTILTASGTTGNVKNGGGATAANHATLYNDFGDIYLKNNSGLGVAGATNYMSGGKLTIDGESTLESGQGTGIINISDIEFVDSNADRLTWIKNTSTSTNMVASTGTYFGANQAFQVLTINPTIANASKITPFNFKGMEKSTGKTFIGDNDVTGKNNNGYGIMIPGSVIDYTVTDPIVDGRGFIEHNVAEVKKDNQPLTLSVWGTEEKGVKVQKGRLIIPNSTGILPTLTFTPEATSGSWLYNVTAKSSKIGSTDEVIGEQSNSDPAEWSSKDGNYSYDVEVKYSNKVELAARDVILTESEAAKLLAEADVNAYTQVEGRPFLTSTITETTLQELRRPLDEGQYSRTTQINYTAGTAAVNPTNVMNQTVNVIVVKDGSQIAKDRQDAIYAKDVTIRVLDIADVASQSVFESDYSHAFAINSKGVVSTVQSTPNDYFAKLQAVLPEDVPKDISVTYAFDSPSETIIKQITIHVIPSEANLVVTFVDEVGNSLHLPVTFKRNIGSSVDLTKEQQVLDAIADIQSRNYVLETRPDSEVVQVVTGGSEVTYQFKGIIFIASAPDTIEFGTHTVKASKQRINEPESMSGDLAIQDSRATRKPWVLTAKLDTPLNNGKDTIAGALRYVYKGKEIVLNAGAEEVAGHTNADEKPYKVNSTWSASGDGLKLQTDIGAVKSSGDYTASITWELTDAP
ncbi:hypothetical protein JZO66_14485 [Enterococcus sp. DIV0242_7C1]|uniref:WxL domain-containing protein n=1 Tax=Candidatus Enterococcus dunnyi TaxID=1834192 RepID=A0A200JBL6_9ENTE|nr:MULTISPECIES: hypothetical protein [unclassified Enterococcus]MBO0471763.1 hypothetical protein [Enterococcus sp. DIV0242_7C1]OUZ34623.1 hypothetical protein A5889_000098 [Enterococcus sp. 9D6_DIV0238]